MAGQRGSAVTEFLAPLLYPCIYNRPFSGRTLLQLLPRPRKPCCLQRRYTYSASPSSTAAPSQTNTSPPRNNAPPNNAEVNTSRLNPHPSDYSSHPFVDRCSVTIHAGNGGHGCVSFLREKYIPEGPPNGGDGGNGGNVYIQAVRGETSLHKLSRRPILKAGKGGNGKGRSQGGERGKDVLFTVPVGTVVREVERVDGRHKGINGREESRAVYDGSEIDEDNGGGQEHDDTESSRDKWIRFPGEMKPYDLHVGTRAPPDVISKTNPLAALQPAAPIRLDLDRPMEIPMLLLAGGVGGRGNPHFATKEIFKPKFATKGDPGVRASLTLELRVLADVGLVGLPNAGKSTLLRALTNSRTRVGDWSFTTLQPSIGTVVLDSHSGRPAIQAFERDGTPRENFTIADIPGLIEDAHMDKGLGLGFLRHVERAAVLAFVVDLSHGNAVGTLSSLWREITEYELIRAREVSAETESRFGTGEMLEDVFKPWEPVQTPIPPPPPITSKPWFVIGTKADLPETQDNFESLKTYLNLLKTGEMDHPSGKKNAWRSGVVAVPVSAINAEGINVLPKVVVGLLE